MEDLRVYRNDAGAKIEIFHSGKMGYLSLVYFDSNGKSYVSRRSLPENRLDDLIDTFHNDEVSLIRDFDLEFSGGKKGDFLALGMLVFIVCFSIVKSDFDLKLIVLVIPVSLIIIYQWFKK